MNCDLIPQLLLVRSLVRSSCTVFKGSGDFQRSYSAKTTKMKVVFKYAESVICGLAMIGGIVEGSLNITMYR